VDGSPAYRLGASVVDPDTGTNGTGIRQRFIPEELKISRASAFSSLLPHTLVELMNWQTIDFPAELRFNNVRVYQINGNQNVGWDPAGYPT
ncbi:hypothetical protein F5887DRAFT_844690, partial [Amanita rubescens]